MLQASSAGKSSQVSEMFKTLLHLELLENKAVTIFLYGLPKKNGSERYDGSRSAVFAIIIGVCVFCC